MSSSEPNISVGVIGKTKETQGAFNGLFELPNSVRIKGAFKVVTSNGKIILYDDEGIEVIRSGEIRYTPLSNANFTIYDIPIGINFHWEKKENQTFEGSLCLRLIDNENFVVINEIGIEKYLSSVIASEMSAEAPIEFLKAQAITSRSWLVAMLEKQKRLKNANTSSKKFIESENEIICWYDREDHQYYDVCADDHCQRYQGITKIISDNVKDAIESTRGLFLVFENKICDARFSKACGGRTELFENCWEDEPKKYIRSVSDSAIEYPKINNEQEAEQWILSSPECYCNTQDQNLLKQILPKYDQSTFDFFRWKVEYSQEELAELLKEKSGIDFGEIEEIAPLKRGPSGRIYKLKITGSKCSKVVGKELEIRRWLSKTHLYSSAFVINVKKDDSGIPKKIILHGAGWGHGVGLCQIGAAVMAAKGFSAEEIVKHYFKDVEIKNLY